VAPENRGTEKQLANGKSFCRAHNVSEYSFYAWRRQLGVTSRKPVRFALVETTPGGTQASTHTRIELLLTGGERLHIPADAASLRLVLSALREQK
jgi:hypothetical protein